MLRRTWQLLMIALAENAGLKAFMEARAPLSNLARRYVGGNNEKEALEIARQIFKGNERSIRASLYYMGEYHLDLGAIEKNVEKKIAIAHLLGRAGLDVHISVDPTQVGYSFSPFLCQKNLYRIAQEIGCYAGGEGVHCLMLDMEDSSITSATIDLFRDLKAEGFPMALTLQAYLRRTEGDLQKLIKTDARVRLVRGSFAENRKIAFTSFRDIKESYLNLSKIMLSPEARKNGFYPIFGTHDHNLHAEILKLAQENGWAPGSFELEMLYGARPDVEGDLYQKGHRVRVYLPFGKDWWPYALRRIGENPKGAHLLLRAIFQKK